MALYRPLSTLPDRPRSTLTKIADFLIKWGGVSYCLFMMAMILYLARFVACPQVYGTSYCSGLNLLATVIISELLGNLGLFLYFAAENKVEYWQRHYVVASLCRSGVEENGEGESSENNPHKDVEGKFCVDCNREAPIRSHHCPLCHLCVLRKDHHCYITGACVGLGNQRYFIVFLFWAVVGTAIGAYYMFWYMNQEIEPWYPFGFIHYIAPVAVFKWLFIGSATLHTVVICVMFSFAVGSSIAALGFFTSQIFYTLHGYTMFEYHSLSIREAYDGDGHSGGERMRLVFGPFYVVNFLFPAVWWKQRLTADIADNLFRGRRIRSSAPDNPDSSNEVELQHVELA